MPQPDRHAIDQRILELLRVAGHLTADQVAERMAVDRFGVRGALDRLQSRQLVRRISPVPTHRAWGTRPPPTVWEATRP